MCGRDTRLATACRLRPARRGRERLPGTDARPHFRRRPSMIFLRIASKKAGFGPSPSEPLRVRLPRTDGTIRNAVPVSFADTAAHRQYGSDVESISPPRFLYSDDTQLENSGYVRSSIGNSCLSCDDFVCGSGGSGRRQGARRFAIGFLFENCRSAAVRAIRDPRPRQYAGYQLTQYRRLACPLHCFAEQAAAKHRPSDHIAARRGSRRGAARHREHQMPTLLDRRSSRATPGR